jgi:hypothetical protein
MKVKTQLKAGTGSDWTPEDEARKQGFFQGWDEAKVYCVNHCNCSYTGW